jgi:hypothetical protein
MAEDETIIDTRLMDEVHIIQPHKSCGWSWRLSSGDNMRFHPTAKPNRFYRCMQRVCLGIIWERD